MLSGGLADPQPANKEVRLVSYGDVNCERCKHDNTDTCLECEHGPDREDWYEPYTDQEWAAKQEEWRHRAIEAIESRFIDFEASEEFKAKFDLMKQFFPEPEDKPGFYCAYCGKDYILATNTHLMTRILCDVPKELQNQAVISLEDGKARISLTAAPPLLSESALKMLDQYPGEVHLTTKDTITLEPEEPIKGENRTVVKAFGKVLLNKDYLDKVLRCFPDGENIQFQIVSPRTAVTIEAANLKAIILPIYRGSWSDPVS